MSNRARIRLQDLHSNLLWSMQLKQFPMPPTLEPLAFMCSADGGRIPEAVLARSKATGLYVAWRSSGVIKNVDARKAEAALAALEAAPAETPDEKDDIAQMLKAWRAEADLTQSRAAEMLGMSVRSYQGIEAGRGFVYPKLLTLALLAFKGTP